MVSMVTSSQDMLYSLVLKLIPTCEVEVGATVGHLAHAAFLKAVQESDAALSEALHTPHQPIRPFTVSPLMGVGRVRNGQVRLSPGQDYFLRLTVLHPPIFERLMARFLKGEGRLLIQLGQAHLLIKEILVTPGSHPWAGYTSWTDLMAGAMPEAEITLDFASPTAFSFGQKEWGKKVVVLPEPGLVFGSLIRTWNSLSPPLLRIERDGLTAYVEDNVVVTRLNGLETRMLHFSRSPQVGFVGRVTYGLMADNLIARRALNALADFAFYAGVGMKTTMGMGQCRRMTSGC